MAEEKSTPKPKVYVVVSDAVVVPVGTSDKGKTQHARVLRGGEVRGPEDSEVIVNLLAAGAIKPVANADELAQARADLADPELSRLRQTAQQASRQSGAADDPVRGLVEGAVPLPAGVIPNLDVS